MDEGLYPAADIVDAAYTQSGPIWEEAFARAIRRRAPNMWRAVLPFLGGPGLKTRTEMDIQIDRMYNQMYNLFVQKDNMSPEEYRRAWNELRLAHPYMEVVLMSKKDGLDRDEALAWSVINRIPPGQTKEIAKLVGIKDTDITNFYESKADLAAMKETDRMRFMAAILDIGALLDVPPNATREEWDNARVLYQEMRSQVEAQYGDDIWQKIDVYFAKRDPENREPGRTYLKNHPEVEAALDLQQRIVQSTPLLAAYYTSQEEIRQYYKRKMYDVAERLFGEDLWELFDAYSQLKKMGETRAARQFWRDHPQLSAYMQFREDQMTVIEARVAALGARIPEPKPPVYRGEEPLPEPQIPMSDDSEARVTALVLSYAEKYTSSGRRPTNIVKVIREDADERWPETKAKARHYFNLLRTDPTKAAQYLLENPELYTRVMWELDRIISLSLAQEGALASAAAQEVQQQQPLTPITPSTPVERLLLDAQRGIPLPEFVLEMLGQ